MKKVRLDLARILAVAAVLCAILFFYLTLFAPKSIPAFLRIGVLRQPINILVLGTDMNYNAETGKPMPELQSRADSLALIHIDPVKYQINILSIPRDAYVEIPSIGFNKINAAPVYGGIPLLEQTVEKITRQKIDYFIELKPQIVPKLVNAVGGVTLYVEKDMYYNDSAQNLHINLKQGWQKLNGDRAHQYIRFRHDTYGDIGRVARQQNFLVALRKALIKPTNLIRAPFAMASLSQEIKTNLPLLKSFRLINFARMSIINSATVSGEATFVNGASVWKIDYAALEKQIKQLF